MEDKSIQQNQIPKPKLNILALPSFTALLFGLIIFVILGSALASLLPTSQLWWPPFVLSLIMLTLRDFLSWPARNARQYELQPADDKEAGLLQDMLIKLSQQAATSPPQLLISPKRPLAYAFGTFRRRFVGMGHRVTQGLADLTRNAEDESAQKAQAILAHELAHFLNHDIQLAGLSRSLLKITLLVSIVNMWAYISLAMIAVDNGREVTHPQFWSELGRLLPLPGLDLQFIREYLRAQNPSLFDLMAKPGEIDLEQLRQFFSVYVVTVHLPFILSVPILYFFFWRKLMRMREFYADARAAALMGNAVIVSQARILYSFLKLHPSPPNSWFDRLKRKLPSFRWSLLNYHPEPKILREALDNPVIVFGKPWEVAIWTGLAMLLLELILRGSLTVLYIYQPGPHLPLLAANIVFAIWLLPHICQGQSIHILARFILIMAPLFIIIKLTLIFLDGLYLGLVALLGDLEALGRTTDIWLYALLGTSLRQELPQIVGHQVSWTQFTYWYIIGPIAYFIFFAIPLLVITLLIDSWLKQKALTWYRLAGRIRWVFWIITAVLLIVQILVVLPLSNRLFFPLVYPDWSLPVLLGLPLGLFLGIGGIAIFIFLHLHLSNRCLQCHTLISTPFKLGHRCPQCQIELHAWLIAPY